jgi:hypothetical protein
MTIVVEKPVALSKKRYRTKPRKRKAAKDPIYFDELDNLGEDYVAVDPQGNLFTASDSSR